MYLRKEDVKVRTFKAVLENGKKVITQANEALLKMKLTKAHIYLSRLDYDDYEEDRPEGNMDRMMMQNFLMSMGMGMGMGGYSH
jgi:hypothetical protein